MKIILKHTVKNMISKPLRTLLLLFCVTICSFAAMLVFDMSNSLENVMTSFYGQIGGTADLLVSYEKGLEEEVFKEAPECSSVFVANETNALYKRDESLYSYVIRESLSIMGCDIEAASKMGLIPRDIKLKETQIAITENMAKDYGYKVGDEIELTDEVGNKLSYEVAYTLPQTGMLLSKNAALLSVEGIKQLYLDKVPIYSMAYIDLQDGAKTKEMKRVITNEIPTAEVTPLYDSKEVKEVTAKVKNVFLVLFLVCLLLVLFVTISVSERMVCEKMSVIGTFRSLGISSAITSFILLMENGFYGLIGGSIGAILYSFLREPILNSMLVMDTSTGIQMQMNWGETPILYYVGVIIGAVVIECFCPLKEIRKAAKTSIRDIIFDNKDTEYRGSKQEWISGVVLLLAAVGTALCPKIFWSLLICFCASVGAVFLLYPYMARFFSMIICKVAKQCSMPVAHFAAMEISKKKSTVGSGRLCVTAVSICLVLFIISNSYHALYTQDIYDCDLLLEGMTEKVTTYRFIEKMEGVDAYEYIYTNMSENKINGQKKTVNVFGYESYKYFKGIEDLPEQIKNNECVMDASVAKKLGVREGDTVTITFQCNSFMPITKKLKLIGYCDSMPYDCVGQSVVISKELYQKIFLDCPQMMLVKTKDVSVKEKIENYSAGSISDVKTLEDYQQEQEIEASGMKGMFMMLIVLGVGLTFIGNVSNQLIGLEGRKRECAVLMSTSMSRAKLCKLFLLESLFSVSAALFVAIPLGLFLIDPLAAALEILGMTVPMVSIPGEIAVFAVVMWLIFGVTVLLPIKHIRKMNISEQLKYE